MGTCRICKSKSALIATELGLCLACIRSRPREAESIARTVHARLRQPFGLPGEIPRDPDGVGCNLCGNRCRIPNGQWSYCGLRKNVNGRIRGVGAFRGKLSWYTDPLPTNCVGDWVCPGGTGCGYPQYAYRRGAEYGYRNLAVFTHACTFHCLYCQNWHFRHRTFDSQNCNTADVLAAVSEKVACICYFGGDPSPQLPFLAKVSRRALAANAHRILRICWETNGSMAPATLSDMADTALQSGGCIKFDLKAWDESLHIALTGVSNRQTKANFKRLARRIPGRPVPPFLIGSTLMVPGYVDDREVSKIAGFIAGLDTDIPYSLLAFHPQSHMSDLPPTSRRQAQAGLQAARQAGLKRVRVGNEHLLW
jgi:pyruvate formate lyase activating enzyme